MATDPWPIDNSGGLPAYSAAELRQLMVVAFMAGAGASLGVRSGVRQSGSATDLLVQAQASPNMTVKVNTGVFIGQGAISSAQGGYTWALDTLTNLTISAAHATLSRTDLVVVRIRDANVDTSGQRDGNVVVITGTAGGGVPSLPTDASYYTIAQIAVGAAVTSITSGNITDKRPFTAALGGTIWCTSSTRPTSSTMPDGQTIYETDTRRYYRNDLASTTWCLDRPDAFWTDYTSQHPFSAAGGGFVLGTGGSFAEQARWRYVGHKQIMIEFHWAFGTSGPSQGSGNFRVAVPSGHTISTTGDGASTGFHEAAGTITAENAAGSRSFGTAYKVTTSAFEMYGPGGYFAGGGGTWPTGSWTVNQGISGRIVYTEA